MDGEQPVSVLEELLAVKGEHLLRTAVLLAGSHADGEDLLQAALERVFRHWRTIRGDPEGYLPVRLVSVPRPAGVYVSLGPLATGTLLSTTIEFRWLPATPANLAQLTAPIPAGFTVSG